MIKGISVPICALALALQGCSDLKAANEANFEAAFNNYVATGAPKEKSLCYSLPHYEPEKSRAYWTQVGDKTDAEPVSARFYDTLTSVGLFQSTTKQFKKGFFSGTEYTYPLAPKGKALLVESEGRGMLGSTVPLYSLCVGNLSLDEVVRWTEPAEKMDRNVSIVTYRMHYDDLPAWTQDPILAEIMPKVSEHAIKPFEREIFVVLTSDGWRIN